MNASKQFSENTPDLELIHAFKKGDGKEFVFRLLIKKYQQKLYWHIRKICIGHDDTDDVLQNTFIKVWQNLDNFKEEAKLYTWLYRIATNEALAFINKQKGNLRVSVEDVAEELSNKLDDNSHISGEKIQIELQKALLTLPEKQRLVFNMKYFDEMKYEDMSEILETSVGALKASYHHAVKKIEQYFKLD